MFKKRGIDIFFLTALTLNLYCQEANSGNLWQPDSSIIFKGYVLDTITNYPERLPIKAKMVIERLPYGSEIEITSTKDSTGQFLYEISGLNDYNLTITANGYESISETISHYMRNASGNIERNYFLLPNFKKGDVLRLNRLFFERGKAELNKESAKEIAYLLNIMDDNPNMTIQLEGHTDYVGNSRVNHKLSQDRVKAVKNYMVSQGIESKRVKTKAFGGSRPLSRQNTPEAHRLNRRVEVRILKTD